MNEKSELSTKCCSTVPPSLSFCQWAWPPGAGSSAPAADLLVDVSPPPHLAALCLCADLDLVAAKSFSLTAACFVSQCEANLIRGKKKEDVFNEARFHRVGVADKLKFNGKALVGATNRNMAVI